MFWAAFPLAVCEILLFTIPGMGQQLQYVYYFVVYTLMNAVFYTANNVAYSSLSDGVSFLSSLRLLVTNRYYLLILAFYLLQYGLQGVTNSAGILFCTYVLDNPDALGLFSFARWCP